MLLQHVHGGGPSGPPPGLDVLSTLTLYFGVIALGLAVAPRLTRTTAPPTLRRVLVTVSWSAALVTAAAAAGRGELGELVDGGGAHLGFTVVHIAVATVWIGGVLHLALVASSRTTRGGLAHGIRRFTPYAVTSAATLVATGVLLLRLHDVGIAALRTSSYGHIVVVKALLLATAAVLGWRHRRASSHKALQRRPALMRIEASVLAAALGLAVVLAGMEPPIPPVTQVAAGLVQLNLGAGGGTTSLFAVRRTPSTALVEVAGEEPVLLHDEVGGADHRLQPGETAAVTLSGGRAQLRVVGGQSQPAFALTPRAAVRTTATSPATWTDFQLGRAVSGSATTPAADCNRPDAARLGGQFATVLRGELHVTRTTVVSDADPVARAFVGGIGRSRRLAMTDVGDDLRRAGRTHGVVVIAASRSTALKVLTGLSALPHGPRAVYLAPWLLDGAVLNEVASLRLPPVTVGATNDPMSLAADRYRVALAHAAPGAAPSAAGLAGYADTCADSRVQMYAAEPVGFLPGVLNVGHQHSDHGWFAGGTLVPITSLENS
ncbi:MAG: copper resistance D family protein [Nocardioidaceae bacterium]